MGNCLMGIKKTQERNARSNRIPSMPNAPCPMPNAPCPMPYAPCPMPNSSLF
ncbi:histidine kinase [Tolypothrix sp. VBCCA 56010]|uniref:histidine kinase n=1 Tax=Tolypothrix sp. VBCCA 56010 TaxID=3137731 RepID=UPI003D7D16F7